MAKIKPYPGYVLVEEENQEVKLTSGVEIEDEEKQSVIGKVIEVPTNDGRIGLFVQPNRVNLSEYLDYSKKLKIGERVVFRKYTGNEVELEDKKYQIIAIKDIIAILK